MSSLKVESSQLPTKTLEYNNSDENEIKTYPTLDLGLLSKHTQEIAQRELRETPENVHKGLEDLRKLIEDDSSIYIDTSDNILTVFLRPCKFYAESAFLLIKRICEFKQKHDGIFGTYLLEDVTHIMLNHNLASVLPQRDHKGRRIIIENLGAPWNPSKVSADELFKILYTMTELAVIEQETQVRGIVVIMDYHGLTMKQMMALTPATCAKLIHMVQEAIPLRVKEVHVVRQPVFFKPVWSLTKSLANEKMRKRLFFHGYKMSSLHKFIPPNHLPKDYEGDLPPLTHQGHMWSHFFNEHVDHMQKMSSCRFVQKL